MIDCTELKPKINTIERRRFSTGPAKQTVMLRKQTGVELENEIKQTIHPSTVKDILARTNTMENFIIYNLLCYQFNASYVFNFYLFN